MSSKKVSLALLKKLPGSYYFGFFIFLGGVSFLAHTFTLRLINPIEYVSSQLQELAPPVRHLTTPEAVRGIYMTSWVAGTPSLRDELIRFIDRSELNSVVIDVKDYTGKISFEVKDETLQSLNYSEKRIADVRSLIDELHRKDIYVIARIAVFQDPHLVKVRPDLALKRKNGLVWKDRKGLSWVDPASQEVWDLTLRIAREAEAAGFDELNFDYIRFPSDGNINDIVYPFWDGKTPKSEVIKNFFIELNRELASLKIPISGDIFGLTTWNTDDLNIGQILEDALQYLDYVSPMVYPSHYPSGFQGYKNPAQHPYEVIKTALTRAREREMVLASTTPSKLRPWLQDFDLGADYDSAMVRLEMQAVYDAGLSSWLSWDPSNRYSQSAYFRPAQ